MIWRAGLLLSWTLSVATFIFLLVSYSNPFTVTPKQDPDEATSTLRIKNKEGTNPNKTHILF